MLPVVIVGLFFKNDLEKLFNENLVLVGSMLIVTAILLCYTYFVKTKEGTISFFNSLIIGLAQAIAVLPGISRSGATIATALFLGIKKEEATKFSFLLAIPILLFAFVYSLISNFNLINSAISMQLTLGFLSSLIVGYFSIGFLVKLISNQKLWYFSIYCMAISLIIGYQYGT